MKNYQAMTIQELKNICDSKGLNYKKSIKKLEIINLIEMSELKNNEKFKKYIQISERNFKYFFTKGFIFPLRLVENIEGLGDDIFKFYLDYIPIVLKNIEGINNDIFIELKEDLEEKYFEFKEGILLYNGLITLSKIKFIYISDKEIYESVINSNFSTLYIPKDIIYNKKIDLENTHISKGEYIKNDKLALIEDDFHKRNIELGGKQMLKLIDINLYNDFIFSKDVEELNLLYNYEDEVKNEKNYNDYLLIDFIKKNIRDKISFDGKESLNSFYDFFGKTIKNLIDQGILDVNSEGIEKLRFKAKKIKDTIDKRITIKELLNELNETEDYGIIIYLLLNKYGKIEELASFIELGINFLKDIKIKLLLSYLYGEIVGYNSLFVEKEIGGRNIKFKLDITDELDNDIYENKADKDKIIKLPKIIKLDEYFQFVNNLLYGNSNSIIGNEVIVPYIKKNNIQGYGDLENEVNNLKNEIIELNKLFNLKNNELEEKNNLIKELKNNSKKLEQIKTIINENNEFNLGTKGNNQLQFG
ncbi:MAG: hypothetical protein Q8K30_02070 [Candidatus Gracilibacteria bacterium]|nr:hypothetical protein [Candidatus Gracilibacteria bacterium]